ncbi:MAG: hypothetical protein R3C59_09520 [Planctomycetaceae bacterium]
MGLDMYLTGERCMSRLHSKPRALIGERYNLGYWRKHSCLHSYIVQQFNNGVDDCREICLDESALQQILTAIREDQLPYTTGDLVEEYDSTAKDRDLACFSDAIAWLTESDIQARRYVEYRASW